jgi:hypothetical protein
MLVISSGCLVVFFIFVFVLEIMWPEIAFALPKMFLVEEGCELDKSLYLHLSKNPSSNIRKDDSNFYLGDLVWMGISGNKWWIGDLCLKDVREEIKLSRKTYALLMEVCAANRNRKVEEAKKKINYKLMKHVS